MIFGLKDRVVVVTGGSRGIGRATCLMLAQQEALIVFSYHTDRTAADSLVREVSSAGGSIRAVQADARKSAEIEGVIEEAHTAHGRLDVVVVNAGIWDFRPVPIEEMTDDEWGSTLDVNLRGAFHSARISVALMKPRREGRIVFVSSTAGQRGEAFHAHYAASKSGIIGLTKSLAVEGAQHGILVNCVAPGWVDTSMSAPALASADRDRIFSGIPLGRPAAPEEVASAILFLSSPLSSYITGEILNVNGGSVLCG